MRRDELCARLQRKYTEENGCGVTHVADPSYRNLWFVVPPPPPRRLKVSVPVDRLKAANDTLERLTRMGAEDSIEELTAFLFVRCEAAASSRIEGTWSTVDEVLTPVWDANEQSATASTRGYAEALERHFGTVRQVGYPALTHELIRDLHRTVVAKDPNFHGRPGTYRAPGLPGSIVHIGGLRRPEESIYNPAPPEFVETCMDQTLAWFSDDVVAEMGDAGIGGIPLLVRMAIGHVHFEAVHPFSDGNGRVGRMLWPLQMALSGYLPVYLSGYVEVQKEAYLHGLSKAQKQLQYDAMIAFICDAVTASGLEVNATRSALVELPSYWRATAQYRVGSTAERALETLLKTPIVTVELLADQLNVSKQAANLAVRQLMQNGVVRERTGKGRNRQFAAEEVTALLTRRFGEAPQVALDYARRLMS